MTKKITTTSSQETFALTNSIERSSLLTSDIQEFKEEGPSNALPLEKAQKPSTSTPVISQEQKLDENRKETRELLLQNVQNSWDVCLPSHQESKKDSSDSDTFIPQESLQNIAKHIILPQIQLENVPFSEALKILSETITNQNPDQHTINFILVDPEHHAKEISLNIKDAPLTRIIQYLCEMTKFTALYEENAIVFRDSSIQSTVRTCIFPVSRGSILQILSYTKLNEGEKKQSEEESLKQFFKKIGIPFDNKNTGFAYDGQNLIVTHENIWLQRIESLLHHYQNCKQIAIEAKFMEIQEGALKELGLKFTSGIGENNNNNVQVNMNSGLRKLSALHSGSTGNNAINAPQFPNSLNFGSNVSDFLNANTILNRYQMNVVLRAIEQHSGSDLMCAPKVTVLSGRKAEIIIADELRYPENYRDGSSNVGNDGRGSTAAGVTIVAATPEKFTTRNVGVEMTVLPIAEENGDIHLTLEPKVTEFEGFVQYGGKNVTSTGNGTNTYDSGFYQPTFSTRKIKTEVSIQNGSTVVMGGLTREEIKETHDRIPLLGDIPILGKLFQSKGKTSQKKNLVIFVTANLVNEKGQYVSKPEIQTPIHKTCKR